MPGKRVKLSKEKLVCSVVDCKLISTIHRLRDGRVFCKGHYKRMKRAERGTYYEQEKKRRAEYNRTPKARLMLAKSKAKVRGIPWSLSLAQYEELIKNPCRYCRGIIAVSATGLDRNDPRLGYAIENVVPCCYTCNTMKGFMTDSEFTEHVTKIASFNE